MSVHDANRAQAARFRSAFGQENGVQQALADRFAPDASIQMGHPFGHMQGADDFWDTAYAPLLRSFPDLERRDFIVMAGPRWGAEGPGNWVGIGGNFVGTFVADWLGIPATHQPTFMRYHEYWRIEDGQVVDMQGLWDIPQVMVQAGVWPMPPQAGVEWMCPGPADGCGTTSTPFDPEQANASVQLVWDMLHDLKQGTATTPERGLGGYWAQNAYWFGPTGLGTARGHAGIANKIFRQFREGLSNNTRHLENGVFFGDHSLVAFTGWPSGTAVHSGPGFLGLEPTGRTVTRCSLDFWRIADGLVQECWVMIDMLDLLRQLGINVLEDIQKPQHTPT